MWSITTIVNWSIVLRYCGGVLIIHHTQKVFQDSMLSNRFWLLSSEIKRKSEDYIKK